MYHTRQMPIWVSLVLAMLILAARGSSQPEDTFSVDSSPDTQIPPTKPIPPPTETLMPPAETTSPATSTSVPPPTALPSATPTESPPAYQTYTTGEDHGYSMEVADLNGDTHPDIMVADSGSDVIGILYNLGDVTFQEPTEIATGEDPRYVGFADLDGATRILTCLCPTARKMRRAS